jgi:hypothetical protein
VGSAVFVTNANGDAPTVAVVDVALRNKPNDDLVPVDVVGGRCNKMRHAGWLFIKLKINAQINKQPPGGADNDNRANRFTNAATKYTGK